jgi:hypothetical protein
MNSLSIVKQGLTTKEDGEYFLKDQIENALACFI